MSLQAFFYELKKKKAIETCKAIEMMLEDTKTCRGNHLSLSVEYKCGNKIK